MEIFDTIATHSAAQQLPLYAVTATAIQKSDTPIVVMLHWHGFTRGQENTVRRSVAGSAVQINARWNEPADIDRAVLDAGWKLGAWDVERVARPAWGRLNAPVSEAVACHRAFGDYSDLPDGSRAVIVDAPDQQELLALAARRGYLRWLFRPRKGGVWSQLDGDDCTLDADGGRSSPCPVALQPDGRKLRCLVRYRLGRGRSILIQ